MLPSAYKIVRRTDSALWTVVHAAFLASNWLEGGMEGGISRSLSLIIICQTAVVATEGKMLYSKSVHYELFETHGQC